jgi:hypothetical protein
MKELYKKFGETINSLPGVGTDSYSDPTYSLKDIGLSKIRFNWIIKDVDFFIKNREKRQKAENIVSTWNNFLTKNKSLNRDKKLEKILK